MKNNTQPTWKYYGWSDTQAKRITPDNSVKLGLVLLLVGLIPVITTISGLYLVIRGVVSRGVEKLYKRQPTRRFKQWP